MSRKTGVITGLMAALVFAGCSSEPSSLTVVSNEDNTVEAVAVNASQGSESTGNFTVGENELTVVNADMTTGMFHVVMTREGSDQAAVDNEFYADGETEYMLEPGEYVVNFIIPEKTNGTIKISTKAGPEGVNDGQNPVMNFIGVYAMERCSIKVDPEGAEDAKFTISWGSSAAEHSEWEMSGTLNTERLTVDYDNAVRKNVVFKEDGSIDTETVVYENGKGTFTFSSEGPLTLTWDDAEENIAEGMLFEYVSVAN